MGGETSGEDQCVSVACAVGIFYLNVRPRFLLYLCTACAALKLDLLTASISDLNVSQCACTRYRHTSPCSGSLTIMTLIYSIFL